MRHSKILFGFLAALFLTVFNSCKEDEQPFSIDGRWNLYSGETTVGTISFSPTSVQSSGTRATGHGILYVTLSDNTPAELPFSYEYYLDIPDNGQGRLELTTDLNPADFTPTEQNLYPIFTDQTYSFTVIGDNSFQFNTVDRTRSWHCTPYTPPTHY